MKKILLSAAVAMMSMAAGAQEITITPSVNEDGKGAFAFSPDESYFYVYLTDNTVDSLKTVYGLADDNFIYMGPEKDDGRFLYYWDGTVTNAANNEDNCFGSVGGYYAWRVTTFGWSGLGWSVAKNGKPMNLSYIDSEYSFHFAIRSTTTQSVDIYMTDVHKKQTHIVLGQTNYGANKPLADFPRDGKWYDVEIPMSYLEDQFEFTLTDAEEYVDNNYLVALIGTKQGEGIDLDAMFYHGPKAPVVDIYGNTERENATGIENIQNHTGRQATGRAIYDLQGRQLGNQGTQKGLALVIDNGTVRKVIK